MRRHILLFGSIAGGVLVAMMYLTAPFLGEGLSYDTAEVLGYTTMVIALSAIFVGVKSYRDKESGGLITFGKAFQVGFLIALVASAIYVAGWMLYINTTESNFMDSYIEQMVQKLEDSGASRAEIQSEVATLQEWKELYKNPLVQIVVTLIEIFPVGLLISLVSAAILKKGPNPAT